MVEGIKEIVKFRGLLWALVVRHLHTRYRGSVLGFLWSLLNPLCLMAVYTVVFHYYMRSGTDEHYSIFLFTGLLPWLWMTSSLHEGTASIVSSGHLITKSMFPAHLLPVVSVVTNLINFLLSLPLLFIFMWLGGVPVHATAILLPVVIIVQFMFLQGLVVGLSSLNVHLRDVQHLVGNILTLLFFMCPIVYASTVVPDKYRYTLLLNPFALFTMSYHKILLDGEVPLHELTVLVPVALFVLIGGYSIYHRYRESFAESL